jgi:hypothetical protein
MSERARIGATDDRARGRRAAGPPVEHVRTQCPVLIATLVAMARASKDGRDVDDRAATAASHGSPGAPGIPRQWQTGLQPRDGRSGSAILRRSVVAVTGRPGGPPMTRHEEMIKDGAARLLEDGEHVPAAVVAAPRGSTRQATGWMQLGSPQRGRADGAAE